MIREYVPETSTTGVAGGVIRSPSRQYFTKTSSLFTLSLSFFIKHNSSATRIRFKKYFFVISPVLHYLHCVKSVQIRRKNSVFGHFPRSVI